ncbi:putative sigma54 specific transcriptional regulator, partial [Thermoanaerobacter ethanolicus JW 200]
EVIARFIHEMSPRNKAPFISINCAGIPESLLDAELFGYEEGAFTGARKRGKVGLIELADGEHFF